MVDAVEFYLLWKELEEYYEKELEGEFRDEHTCRNCFFLSLKGTWTENGVEKGFCVLKSREVKLDHECPDYIPIWSGRGEEHPMVMEFLDELIAKTFRETFGVEWCMEMFCDVCPCRLLCELREKAITNIIIKAWDMILGEVK